MATIAGDIGLVGKIGQNIANINIKYFGYLAYVYPFLLLYPLYSLYKSIKITLSRIENTLATLLFVSSFLIIQALLAPKEYMGYIGLSIVEFLRPLVGIAGVVLFLIMLVLMGIFIIFDLSFDSIIQKSASFFAIFKKKDSQSKREEVVAEKKTLTLEESEPFFVTSQLKDEPKYKIELETKKELYEKEEIDYSDKIRIIKESDLRANKEPDLKADSKIVDITIKDEPQVNITNDKLKPFEQEKEQEFEIKSSFEIVKEIEENKKLLSEIELGNVIKPKDFVLPPLDFLAQPKESKLEIDETEIDEKIKDLLDKLHKFKIEGDVVRTYAGPVVTTFEFKPAPHIKVSRILTLEDDLAMALKAKTIRIQAPVPGKDVVGIEIPNNHVETIYLREILESELFQKAASPLTLALGKDIVGKPFITDLKKLPHLLIAGTTGSGKSVGINAMILSLLYKNSPDNLKLLMIDPKMLEFSIYNDIPHLLTPVITKPKLACTALNNMVGEMERRYSLMSKYKVKNIENFNEKAQKDGFETLPYIVVIIDELADLMMTSGKEVEYSIARLAQMARASGIHLIVATQRPSVDVVTGLIKANLPSRISFKVGQKIDSKVILDSFGAEALLGRGDMLFTPPGISGLVRLHAPWSSENEIEKIVEFLKSQRKAEYDESFLDEEDSSKSKSSESIDIKDLDELYEEAKKIVLTERKTSISYIQRRLQIGYNRAANIVEQLQQTGILSPPDNKGNREIII